MMNAFGMPKRTASGDARRRAAAVQNPDALVAKRLDMAYHACKRRHLAFGAYGCVQRRRVLQGESSQRRASGNQ